MQLRAAHDRPLRRLPLAGVHRDARRESSRVEGADVTPSLFGMLGETGALGRFLRADDVKTASPAVAVLSDRGWRERFSAERPIVGRSVDIDGRPATIVGVATPGLAFPNHDARLWCRS